MLLTTTYWLLCLIMAPVTVFGLGPAINVTDECREDTSEGGCNEAANWSMMYVGVIIFWVIMLVVAMATFFMKSGTAGDWYRNVFLYGAHELAELVANRSDELARADGASQPTPCWKPIFIAWWGFSIKYFVPWALLSLMMWNFKADIDFNENGRGYGDYHTLW